MVKPNKCGFIQLLYRFGELLQKLQIENYLELSSMHTGVAYFFWISVDDFASIMGMSVEKVEDDGVYLRMK